MKNFLLYRCLTVLLVIFSLLTSISALALPLEQTDKPSGGTAAEDDTARKSLLTGHLQTECQLNNQGAVSFYDCPPYEDWKFDVRLTGGIMWYKYEDLLMGEVKGHPYFGGVGALIVFPQPYNKWSIEFYGQTSDTLKDNNSKTVPVYQQNGSSDSYATAQEQRAERYDYSINVGITVTSNFKLVGGYKWSDTTVHGRTLLFNSPIVPTAPEWVFAAPSEAQVHVKTGGPFIGGKLIFPVVDGKWGAVGISAAWLKLNGDYSYTNTYLTAQYRIPDLSTDTRNRGRIFGIDWEIPLISVRDLFSVKFNASLNSYRYKMDVLKTVFPNGNSFGDFSAKEDVYTAKLGVIFQF